MHSKTIPPSFSKISSNSEKKKVCILGVTGSIGRSCLDVIRLNKECFDVEAISAYNNIDLFVDICREFSPKAVCVGEGKVEEFLAKIGENNQSPPHVFEGINGLIELAVNYGSLVVAGLSSWQGLYPVYEAVKAGKTVAIANKESLVSAGDLIHNTAIETGAKILPVDSEHNAIFQCLGGIDVTAVRRLILTASGGPFLNVHQDEFENITVKEALAHPNWSMGQKISVDSATMMNKALEIIEAVRLFRLPPEKVEVIVHPESIIHSMVEMEDGSVLAQLGDHDMRVPISYCLGEMTRIQSGAKFLNFAKIGRLNFHEVDQNKFLPIKFAYQVLNMPNSAPAVLNGANEFLVKFFLEERIRFSQIFGLLNQLMDKLNNVVQCGEESEYLFTVTNVDQAILANQLGAEFIKNLV